MESTSPPTEASQEGWDVSCADQVEWWPWGEGGVRAEILGAADGYVVTTTS
jgi:hypothetical protein